MDHNQPDKVVTRFAPSPTGFMHIGGVRTALYSYLLAKKNGGEFILRIEDTDKAREVEGSIEHIQNSLRWLGLEWDYGPDNPHPEWGSALQSDRLDTYKQYAQKLIDKGLAYPDPYTNEEVQAFRDQATAEKRPFLFRDHRPENTGVWDGTQPLRFKVPEIKRYTWHDVVRGELSAGEEMLDDIIIIKADGYPTYNFAHIIDDHLMGITHVMRGEEFISSTPKFLSLFEALEIEPPIFATLPPIMGPDGKKKLSKRDGAKDLLEYEKEGILPEAMRNFLALIGWNPGGEQEIFPSNANDQSLIDTFSLDRIQKSGGAFNEDKLAWMNKQYLDRTDNEFKIHYFIEGLPDTIKSLPQYTDTRAALVAPIALERINTKNDIETAAKEGEYDWAFKTPTYETTLLKWKNDDSVTDGVSRLKKVTELLQNADFGTAESIKAAIWPYAEEIGRGEVLWPLRTSLSGAERSPDPFSLLFVLGKEESLIRINTACDKIGE